MFKLYKRVTKGMLKMLKKAGCKEIFFGVESGSNKLLQLMNKKHKVSEVKKIFRICHEVDIKTSASFILGYPRESISTLIQTYNLIRKIKPHKLKLYTLILNPGTEVYKLAKRQSLITDDFWLKKKKEQTYGQLGFKIKIKIFKKILYLLYNLDKKISNLKC